MHVLTILDHPSSASFSAAVAHRFMEGAETAGHSVELADLHAEGFDPRWSMADIDRDDSTTTPTDVKGEQERIERADAICLVFPLYWWGMPSMTKGWVDRVWSWGWAYDQLADPDKSLQRPRTVATSTRFAHGLDLDGQRRCEGVRRAVRQLLRLPRQPFGVARATGREGGFRQPKRTTRVTWHESRQAFVDHLGRLDLAASEALCGGVPQEPRHFEPRLADAEVLGHRRSC